MKSIATVDRREVVTIHEPSERACDGGRIATGEGGRIAGRESLTDDRGMREERAIIDFELIEPRAERPAERERELSDRFSSARELHDEERVSLGAGDGRFIGVSCARRESLGSGSLKPRELDEEAIATWSNTGGLGELRPCRGDQKKRLTGK